MGYEDYRKEKTESALKYQDFICKWLAQNYGLVLTIFTSEDAQRKGESLQGIEIKHDEMFESTGNLYIETGEKARPRDGEYARSGIYKEDNTWLWIIGNRKEAFIFSKKRLIEIHEDESYLREVPNNSTNTSEGFLLNRSMAEKYCAKKLNFNA